MKITIDTENKIIEVYEEFNLAEFLESIYSLLGDIIKDYTVKPVAEKERVIEKEKIIEYVPYNPPYMGNPNSITSPAVWYYDTNSGTVSSRLDATSIDIDLANDSVTLVNGDITSNTLTCEQKDFKSILSNFQS